MAVAALSTAATLVAAYVVGSIPFAAGLTRWRAGVAIWDYGSGHAGTTNAFRAAGPAVAMAVLVLDMGKGFMAVWAASRLGLGALGVGAAGFGVVVGHCWPISTRFRGGMGMAPAGGCLLAAWPLGFAIAVGLASLVQLLVHHSARANSVAGVLLPLVWLVFGARGPELAAAAAVGAVVAARAVSDWRRVYAELWLDRGGNHGDGGPTRGD